MDAALFVGWTVGMVLVGTALGFLLADVWNHRRNAANYELLYQSVRAVTKAVAHPGGSGPVAQVQPKFETPIEDLSSDDDLVPSYLDDDLAPEWLKV